MKFTFPLFFLLLSLGFTFSISGRVVDKETNQPLETVVVNVVGTKVATTTDEDGKFMIAGLDKGTYQLKFLLIGYQEKVIKVEITEKTEFLKVSLSREAIPLEEVIITAPKEAPKTAIPSVTKITTTELKKLPSMGGDVLKALDALPGFVPLTEWGAAFCVRGGNPNENLILVDNMQIGYPFHWEGFASSFCSEAIEDIDIYAGGFPVKYGNKLSSVLDIELKPGGEEEKLDGRIDLGLMDTKIYLERKLDRKTKFFLSGKRTYYDLIYQITRLFLPQREETPNLWFGFWDLQGKLHLVPDDKNKFVISILMSQDLVNIREKSTYYYRESWENGRLVAREEKIRENIFKYNKGYSLFGGNWFRVWGDKLSQQTTLYFRHYYERFFAEYRYIQPRRPTESAEVKNFLNTYHFNTSLTLKQWKNHEVKIGLEAENLAGEETLKVTEGTVGLIPVEKEPIATHKMALYLQDKYQFSPRLVLIPGLRYDYYRQHFEHCLVPRLNLEYELDKETKLKSALGWYFQPAETVEERVSSLLTSDFVEAKSLKNCHSARAFHFVLGVEKILPNKWHLRVETYYKKMDHLIVGPPCNIQDLINRMLVEDFDEENKLSYTNSGFGHSEGIEFLLRKNITENSFAWVSYTLSRSKRREGNGEEYTYIYDRTHLLTAAAGVNLGKKWYCGLKFRLSSGIPYTPVIEKRHSARVETDFTDPYEPPVVRRSRWRDDGVFGPRNSARGPLYHRLDLRFERKWGKNKIWFFDLMNVYNQRNIIGIIPFYEEEENFIMTKEGGIKGLPFTPCFGLSWIF
jgi:hypothetical protein